MPSPKPKIYIAAPFFNAAQIMVVQTIESTLANNEFSYYSPRLHSGSDKLTPEERKDRNAWMQVITSNIAAMESCSAMIAVLEFAMPDELRLVPAKYANVGKWNVLPNVQPVELPDTGVVFEMGYMYARYKPIFGYHSTKIPSELNLMLSHTVMGILTGQEALNGFLGGVGNPEDDKRDYFNFHYVNIFGGNIV